MPRPAKQVEIPARVAQEALGHLWDLLDGGGYHHNYPGVHGGKRIGSHTLAQLRGAETAALRLEIALKKAGTS